MKLVHTDTGLEVEDGETVTDFRGESAIVTGRDEPRHSGSTGRVYVRQPDAERIHTHGYYPSVFNLKWIEESEA